MGAELGAKVIKQAYATGCVSFIFWVRTQLCNSSLSHFQTIDRHGERNKFISAGTSPSRAGMNFASKAFWRRRRLGDSPKECLKLSDGSDVRVQSIRVFCQIRIIYLRGCILHNHAFHGIWQLSLLPPLLSPPSSPPLSPSSHPPPQGVSIFKNFVEYLLHWWK